MPEAAMILDRIVQSTEEILAIRKANRPLSVLVDEAACQDEPRDFRGALVRGECSIIAELKRSSPSAGRILEDFDQAARAAMYEKAGAAALSILTEERYFEGSLAYIGEARNVTTIPALRKDFIIDPYQVYEARAAGADAVLLITSLFEESELAEFINLAGLLGMAALVEVHDSLELDRALAVEADIIGINNRDLRTFTVDIGTSVQLAKRIPADRCIVAESGIQNREDILRLQEAGIQAFLVGESLSRSADPARTLADLMGREGTP